MKRVQLLKLIALMVMTGLLSYGFIGSTCSAADKATPSTENLEAKDANAIEGKIAGGSTTSKSISKVVGKGEAAITSSEVRDISKFAIMVKPKLTKLPKGATEMQPKKLGELRKGVKRSL